MAPAIARLLPDFSGDVAPATAPAPAPKAAPRAPDGLALLLRTPPRPAPAPVEDREALLRAAEARGRAEGRAQAQAEAAAALAAMQADFDARLVAERRDWCVQESDRLASGFSLAIQSLGAQLTDRVGRLLVPALTEALRRQAVDELAATLARVLADPQAPPVRVSGPADLLDSLAGKLGPFDGTVAYLPADTADVQVQADRTVIETQLGAWGRLLNAAVEGV